MSQMNGNAKRIKMRFRDALEDCFLFPPKAIEPACAVHNEGEQPRITIVKAQCNCVADERKYTFLTSYLANL